MRAFVLLAVDAPNSVNNGMFATGSDCPVAYFRREALNSAYAPADLGDAFQRFAGEALQANGIDAHIFRTLGRDGAIDIVSETDASVAVYEAKHIGRPNAFKAAKGEIRKIIAALENNLLHRTYSPLYEPWRTTGRPITSYTLCFSCAFKSQSEVQVLRNLLIQCFAHLADTAPGLGHLNAIEVTVLDWSDFQTILREHPRLLLRWFEPSLPSGVEPFDKAGAKRSGFHAYLSSQTLPYFSSEEYARSNPKDDSPATTQELFDRLADDEEGGLVVIAPGGTGKTRLCEEVANLAHSADWVVLRVTSRLDATQLNEKRAFFTASRARYLLLFDYLEDQRETFSDVIQLLEDWQNASCKVRYLANCRPSFERTLDRLAKEVYKLHLAGRGAKVAGFAEWVTDRILNRIDPMWADKARLLTKGLPVLAVFVLYVKNRFGDADLQHLLAEAEFGRWLTKRMPGEEKADRDLALLAAVLPADITSYRQLYMRFPFLLDKLVEDGWVAVDPARDGERWAFVQDVLADHLLAAYLRRIGSNGRLFVIEVLDLAEVAGCIASTLRAFERIADEPVTESLPWAEIITTRLNSGSGALIWKEQRNALLGFRVLSTDEREELLTSHQIIWREDEGNEEFQVAFGRFLTERDLEGVKPSAIRPAVLNMVSRCLQVNRPSLKLIPPALRLLPEEATAAAMRLVRDHSLPLQRKNNVLAALLRACFPFWMIAREIEAWLATNAEELFATSLLIECCRAKDTMAESVARRYAPLWLDRNGTLLGAQWLLKAALGVNSNGAQVKAPVVGDVYIGRWFHAHRADIRARFLMEAWLKVRGRAAVDHPDLLEQIHFWMERFQSDLRFCFVASAWHWNVGRHAAPDVGDFVFSWLLEYHQRREAQFVLTGWLKAHSDSSLRDEARKAEPFVKQWLLNNSKDAAVAFVIPRWLYAMGEEGVPLARTYLLAWLDARSWPLESGQELRDTSFMICSWLTAAGAAGAVEIRESVSSWFTYHPDCEETRRNVLVAWLAAVREPAGNPHQRELALLAEDLVRHILDGPFGAESTTYILRQWLRAAGSSGFSLAEPFALQWLETNNGHPAVEFLFPALLESGGAKALASIDKWLALWLHENRLNEGAGYLYRGALLGDIAHTFDVHIREWLLRFGSFTHRDKQRERRIKALAVEIESLWKSTSTDQTLL